MEGPAMSKFTKLPREENSPDGLPDQAKLSGDGLPDQVKALDDVEGHGASPDDLGPRLPGTGGDFRRPTGGGEATEDDVEGHGSSPDDLAPRLPGTGGDYRRPTSGGELTDDVEGHRQT
jgi:hypothetical protein